MLLPTACPACGASGPAPCHDCRAALRPPPSLPPPPGLVLCAAVMAYEGLGREIVARLKYHNARAVLPWLVEAMVGALGREEFQVVSWVPTSPARRRRRGFDQGRLLARAVARRLGLPCPSLLLRRSGPPQTGRSRAERLRGPTYGLRREAVPERVLLVDDVVTTGATLSAAASRLRAGGATEIGALVAARRP